jgi:hypothetical protein
MSSVRACLSAILLLYSDHDVVHGGILALVWIFIGLVFCIVTNESL